MILHVWKNNEGLHLSRPPHPSQLVEVDFDPNQLCRRCGERVLSISADQSTICPWCESGMNRPKMLRYQELDLVRLLKKQSETNKLNQPLKKAPWIRNGGTEADLRSYLANHGYAGRSTRVNRLELKAIERPGWVQVFEFQVQAKRSDGDWEALEGVCRTDERSSVFEVRLFDSASRADVLKTATDGLITTQRNPRHWSYWPLMTLFVSLLGLAILSMIVNTNSV